MLAAMVKAYDDQKDDQARVQGLGTIDMIDAAKIPFARKGPEERTERGTKTEWTFEPLQPIEEAVSQLVKRGHIYNVGGNVYKPTSNGFAYAREHLASWYVKLLRALGLGSVIRGIIVSAVTSVVVATLVSWLGGLWS